MKKIITGIALSIFMTLGTWAKDDTPRGYQPTSEFEEVAAKAKAKKKMITILVKGSNDSCPNCVTSVNNGERAVKTYSEFLFCRAKQVTGGKTQLPETIASQLTNISYGASVQFFVFDPFEYSSSPEHPELSSKMIRRPRAPSKTQYARPKKHSSPAPSRRADPSQGTTA